MKQEEFVMCNNSCRFGGFDCCWIIILILIFCCGGGSFGWGGNGGFNGGKSCDCC